MKDKRDTPAKRRDCLALLCGLPVKIAGQKELVRCGLAIGEPDIKYSKRGTWAKTEPVTLTPAGKALALRALVEARHAEWGHHTLQKLTGELRRARR